ncbi:hypothetical protein PC129_g1049 [Phytophthora cactorum]|uniref:Uncharacterized protein n=1 Tax=Phytophthora cactorum TaxID=29920 RepID=A0A8T1EFL0_9STRA|nr:hypothetical protein Pcac1_g15437 [Phytophthora cactorum]KAG3110675.1 hypothetical protein PI125_g9819 [Phytophthora idaei]KAG2923846.1 hypothetical protein PC114_g4693 [Phytophthora cactorum]KAG2938185.1 hypothetical protein PC115_g3869 [Phytophthora cactorum]KAG2950534.1 hypothetical protein PC117_g4353 [Phytophthora cactorum]
MQNGRRPVAALGKSKEEVRTWRQRGRSAENRTWEIQGRRDAQKTGVNPRATDSS